MLGFRSRKSAESIAAIEMTPAAAPARAPRLAEHAAAVWQAMNTALYVALLDAAEAELKRCGYSPVYGCLHQQSVASPVRVAVGKAIYQARLKHIAPLIGPNALARAVEQSESEGDALAWADGTLGALQALGVGFHFTTESVVAESGEEISALVQKFWSRLGSESL